MRRLLGFDTVFVVGFVVVFVSGATSACSNSDGRDKDGVTSWPREFPSADALGERRGRVVARSIVHLHSPLSHDACDGMGWADGALADEACLASLRDALCALRIDAAMLTDHAPNVDTVPFEEAFLAAPEDERLLSEGDATVATRIACEGGHEVLLRVGSENDLMPIGLDRHPGDGLGAGELLALYDGNDADAVAAFREAGALVWVAHTESKTVDHIRDLGLDGLELYNLHANVDPNIRADYLGLESLDFIGDLLPFAFGGAGLAPDLAVLSFLEENAPSLATFDTLLAEGVRITGTGGCDAHENTFPMQLSDGERADSYRRMMSWITNHLLVDDRSPASVRDALANGRVYVVFEFLGMPLGFDFVAAQGASSFEMGETAPLGAELRVAGPAIDPRWPSENASYRVSLLRAAEGGGVEVASSFDEGLAFTPTEPGAYRVEVHLTPEHARPFLGSLADSLVREVPWIYSNAIFVE
jgi:hypothetical protein